MKKSLLLLLLLLAANVSTANGQTLVRTWGSSGSAEGQFIVKGGALGMGVGVDSSGNVYVGDIGNNRIQKFANDGTFMTRWGSLGEGDGEFFRPTYVAVDASGNVYVADTGNNRVQKFTSTGTFISKWGSNGDGDGQFATPFGIAIDSSGHVFIADFFNTRIQEFSVPVEAASTTSTEAGASPAQTTPIILYSVAGVAIVVLALVGVMIVRSRRRR